MDLSFNKNKSSDIQSTTYFQDLFQDTKISDNPFHINQKESHDVVNNEARCVKLQVKIHKAYFSA